MRVAGARAEPRATLNGHAVHNAEAAPRDQEVRTRAWCYASGAP